MANDIEEWLFCCQMCLYEASN